MKDKVSLTIGIPIYNGEHTIRKTLDSIIVQINSKLTKLCTLEILICDNCSTDKTANIIKKEYLQKYKNIIKYHKNSTNVGAAKNIKVVFDNASGEYVWLLGDDVHKNNSLYEAVNLLQSKTNPDLIIVQSEFLNEHGALKKHSYNKTKSDHYSITGIDYMEDQKDDVLTFISALILSKSFFQTHFQDYFFENYFPHLMLIYKNISIMKFEIINKILITKSIYIWENSTPNIRAQIIIDYIKATSLLLKYKLENDYFINRVFLSSVKFSPDICESQKTDEFLNAIQPIKRRFGILQKLILHTLITLPCRKLIINFLETGVTVYFSMRKTFHTMKNILSFKTKSA